MMFYLYSNYIPIKNKSFFKKSLYRVFKITKKSINLGNFKTELIIPNPVCLDHK